MIMMNKGEKNMKIFVRNGYMNYEEIDKVELQFRLDYYVNTIYILDRIDSDNDCMYIYERTF